MRDVLVLDSDEQRASEWSHLPHYDVALHVEASLRGGLNWLDATAKRICHIVFEPDLPDGDGTGVLAHSAVCPDARIAVVARNLSAAEQIRWFEQGVLALRKPLDASARVDLLRLLLRPTRLESFIVAHRLSPQEDLVLRGAVLGRTHDEIADQLGCSRSTIATYWNRIFGKTKQHSQRDVLALFVRMLGVSPPCQRSRKHKEEDPTGADLDTATTVIKGATCADWTLD